ncbi:hypothetical protein Anapl_17780 [Anas platyrhynchos]|uniref:Uncharacterized protein n=1 Tax=Anas platyrhynchos TaxID=8839 RepID=R0JGG7_ANAPL|nr:hypothetical protein Anapl_17780 [Anas platyrhynchos]
MFAVHLRYGAEQLHEQITFPISLRNEEGSVLQGEFPRGHRYLQSFCTLPFLTSLEGFCKRAATEQQLWL